MLREKEAQPTSRVPNPDLYAAVHAQAREPMIITGPIHSTSAIITTSSTIHPDTTALSRAQTDS